MGRLKTFAVAVVGLMVVAPVAAAQATCGDTDAATASCSPGTSNLTVTIEKIVRLTITPTNAGLTAPTDADFTAGGTTQKENVDLQSLVIRANLTWSLGVEGGPWAIVGTYTKATGDAAFGINSGGSYTAFTGSPQVVTTGAATAGDTVLLSYQVDWDLTTDVPGVYTLPVIFTISST